MQIKTAKKNILLWKKMRTVILSALLVFAVVLSSCENPVRFLSRLSNDGNVQLENSEPIDATNLMRLLSISLKDLEQTDDVYYSIPTEQLDGVSLSTFRLYTEVVSKMGAGRGKLQSFQIIHGAQREELLTNLIHQVPEKAELIERSVPVELIYEQDIAQNPVVIYFQEKEDGMPYLSYEWIGDCLSLYHFAAHYFSAVTSDNQNAMYSLVEDSFLDMPYTLSEKTIMLKVRQTARFYLLNVKSVFDEYSIQSLDISEIIFEQPNILTEEMEDYQTRQVRFFYNSRGSISIDDRIEDEILIRDLYFYYQGSRTVRIGDMATQSYFDSLLGQPVLTTIGQEVESTSSDERGEVRPQRRIIVDYGATTFTVIGYMNSAGEWEGTITRIRISEDAGAVSLGRVLRAGMTREAFMEYYPFADQTDYILKKQMDEQIFVLKVDFSDDEADVISEIRLEWSEKSDI